MFSVKQQLKTLVILINFSSLTIQKCKYLHCSQKEPQQEVFTFRNMNAATKIVIGLAAIIILAGFGLLLDPLSVPNGELRTTKKETTLGNAKATIDEHTFQRSPSRRSNSYRAPSEENVMHACREHFQLNESELNLHLQSRGYSLASLLTALRLSGNLDYLRQASERFPGQPEISMELALRSESPEERREAIDALRRTDPGKGFADYLSAHEHYLAGDTASALRDFLTAGSKDYIDYPMDPVLEGAEQAYLDNGYSPLEAKVASALSLSTPPIDKLAINAAKIGGLGGCAPKARRCPNGRFVTQFGGFAGQKNARGGIRSAGEIERTFHRAKVPRQSPLRSTCRSLTNGLTTPRRNFNCEQKAWQKRHSNSTPLRISCSAGRKKSPPQTAPFDRAAHRSTCLQPPFCYRSFDRQPAGKLCPDE
jgi:hypothetical protein